jgi:hypothetical protein
MGQQDGGHRGAEPFQSDIEVGHSGPQIVDAGHGESPAPGVDDLVAILEQRANAARISGIFPE